MAEEDGVEYMAEESGEIDREANGGTESKERGGLAEGSLSVKDGVAMGVGDIIGSGIFASPGIVLAAAKAPWLAVVAWVVAGLVSLVGLLCLNELATEAPDAGGLFAFIRDAFGDAAAFSWQFINFFVAVPGSLAAQALTFAHYFASFLPGLSSSSAATGNPAGAPSWGVTGLALGAIGAIGCVNCLSAGLGGRTARFLTGLALCGCAFVAVLGVYALACMGEARAVAARNFTEAPLGEADWGRFGPAIISSLWAFSGWADIAAMAEELAFPTRSLPRVSVAVSVIVTVAYLAMNLAYLSIVPAERMIEEGALAVHFAKRATGSDWPALVMAGFVSASTLSSLHNNLFLSARQFYATARGGLFPKFLSLTGTSSHAPWASVLVTAGLSAFLTCLSSFQHLVNYLSFALWLYYGSLGAAIVVLRRSRPNARRPFKVPFYPYLPITFALACAYMSASTFLDDPVSCGVSFVLVLLAFPIHWLASYRRSRLPSSSSPESTPLIDPSHREGSE